MENIEERRLELIHDTVNGHVSRRSFTRRAVLMGIGAGTIAAVLAACSGGGGGASGTFTGTSGGTKGKEYTLTPDYQPGSAALEVQLGAEQEGPLYPDGYVGPKYRAIEKFGDGTTEFTIATVTPLGMKWETNGFAKFLEETTGVKVKYVSVPFGNDPAEVQTKFNTMIAGGDLPDAFMLGAKWMGGLSPSQAYAYGQQGLFLPLDEMIDKYAPTLKETTSQLESFDRLMRSPDGKVYGFPAVNDCFHCKAAQQRAWINTDWLAKVGMKTPTTTAEFEAVLQAFKDKAPGGARAVPASGAKKDGLIDFLMGSFVYSTSGSSEPWFSLQDGKATFTPTSEGYRKGLTWIRSLFDKGLIDPNCFTQDSDALVKLGDSADGPQFGLAVGGTRGAFITGAPTEPKPKIFQSQPLLAGPDGTTICTWDYNQAGNANVVVLTNQCKDPATLVRWCDAQMDLFMTLQQTRGERGKDWDWSKAGEKGINSKQALYTMIPQPPNDDPAAQFAWSWWEWAPMSKHNDVRLAEAVAEGSTSVEPEIYQIAVEAQKHAMPREEQLPILSYETADATSVATFQTNIGNYMWQSLAKFCTGDADPSQDADWNAFLDGLKSQQVDQYTQIVQSAYDKMSAA
ncbi:extracellular solute-binding protein [Micrococcales bacterium 31B]|nr:extracellular solute-binding protein [Micrococcales bacterium 31B]